MSGSCIILILTVGETPRITASVAGGGRADSVRPLVLTDMHLHLPIEALITMLEGRR